MMGKSRLDFVWGNLVWPNAAGREACPSEDGSSLETTPAGQGVAWMAGRGRVHEESFGCQATGV